MAGSATRDATTPSTGLDPQPPMLVRPVEVAHVVMPLDGSPFAERALVARAEGIGVAVAARVIYDPISVSDGLVPFLDRTATLVVVGSRHRQGLGRIVLGGHAVRIVHDVAVPTLVVPLPPNG